MGKLWVVALMAVRNLMASRIKTTIVGGLVFFGALLVVLGNSFLESVVSAMSRSIIGSVAGHIQVYSARSKDPLEVVGGLSFEGGDLEPIDDFARLRSVLQRLPNVKAVVPMGISGAMVTSGNTIDQALQDLRELYRQREAGRNNQPAIDAKVAHVRQMVEVLRDQFGNMASLRQESAIPRDELEAVNRAATPAFWAEFARSPLDGLEFLENRVAMAAADADVLLLRYVGTDPALFARTFDRLKVVDGSPIPPGQRGFMFNKYAYEEQAKLKTARRLDKIHERLQRGEHIAGSLELQQLVRENTGQIRELLLQLDPQESSLVRGKLQRELSSQSRDVGALLAEFLKTDDANFSARYRFFYEQLAPHLDLYRVRIGDTLTIKAFTRGGYVRSTNLKVYGTFTFLGLEQSAQAGEMNLMDLVSFRELYGFLTAEGQAEIQAMKRGVSAKEVRRDNVEAELFGSRGDQVPYAGRVVVAEATPGANPDEALRGLAGALQREELSRRVYDPKQLQQGVVLNAAVVLNDPRQLRQTISDIERAGKGAGLELKAVSWQEASGLIGQLVNVARLVLTVAMLIIFAIALVIINNAVVMATLERVREFGTLRALGAQRRFVLAMLVSEAVVVAGLFGLLGAAVAGGLLRLAGRVGIPALGEMGTFFFSGPRLYPALRPESVVAALVIVVAVSVISSLYPVVLALRVSPRQAMQTEE
jgi:ABC-type lipoprotein release transport system permease subunit